MQWIPEARTLEALLDTHAAGGPAPPGGWERLLVRIARQVAGLEEARVEHPDLHPGNVLVDAQGAPWLIDFHKARVGRRPPDAKQLREELRRRVEHWTAMVRELLPARLRWRFLLAWQDALPAELALELGELRRDRLGLEERGRRLRRRQVVREIGRWQRGSGRLVVRKERRLTLLVRHGLEHLVDDDGRVQPLAGKIVTHPGRRGEVERVWLCAARLEEHHLPAARPMTRVHGGGFSTAEYGLPEGSRMLHEVHGKAGWPLELARPLGALVGALHDRGLELDFWHVAKLAVAPSGELLLMPPSGLVDFDSSWDESVPGRRLEGLRGCCGARELLASREATAELRAGYLQTFSGQPQEQASLERRWSE
jgi:hypothetical protein